MGRNIFLRTAVAAASAFAVLSAPACVEEVGAGLRPPTPDNLTAEIELGSVRLRWNATDPDEYRLERSDLVSGDFREIARINGDTNEYLDAEVIYGDTYFYRVRAYDDSYDEPFSDYSDEVEITVE